MTSFEAMLDLVYDAALSESSGSMVVYTDANSDAATARYLWCLGHNLAIAGALQNAFNQGRFYQAAKYARK